MIIDAVIVDFVAGRGLERAVGTFGGGRVRLRALFLALCDD